MKMYRILQKDVDSSSDALVARWFRTKKEVRCYVKNYIKNHSAPPFFYQGVTFSGFRSPFLVGCHQAVSSGFTARRLFSVCPIYKL